MERLGKAVIATGMLALAAGACFSDPTSDLRSGATRIQFSRAYLLQGPGDTDIVTITLLDDQGNSIAFDDPTLEPVNVGVADIQPLPDATLRRIPGNTLYKSIVVGVGAGQSFVRVTAGGVTDSIAVVVVPPTIDVTFSPATPKPGDTVTITVTDPGVILTATATATYVGTNWLAFVSRSANSLVYVAGPEGDAPVMIDGATLPTGFPLVASATSTNLVVSHPSEPLNDSYGSATTIAYPANVGDSTVVFGSIGSGDVDDWFRFTPTTATDSVNIRLTWQNGPATDIDLYASNTGVATVPFGFAAATGAHPENLNRRLSGATTWGINVNFYAGTPEPMFYTLILWKR